jgi:hypothetical protein
MKPFEILESFYTTRMSLLRELFASFPECVRDEFLFDLPKVGILQHSNWTFRKHGVGARFSSPSGVVVDVPDRKHMTGYIDRWALAEFIDSQISKSSLQQADQVLAAGVISGALVESGKGFCFSMLPEARPKITD